jgi:hypothetical protein
MLRGHTGVFFSGLNIKMDFLPDDVGSIALFFQASCRLSEE